MNLQRMTIQLFGMMYLDRYGFDDFKNVDNFYAYLGYELESENLLAELGIFGTSDLKEKLENDMII